MASGDVRQAVHVETRELVIAAITGAVFGLAGYYLTRHIHDRLETLLP